MEFQWDTDIGCMDIEGLKQKFSALMPALNERSRRLVAAAEAQSLGWGGITCVAKTSGVSASTISRGMKELQTPDPAEGGLDPSRIRRPEGGRRRLAEKDRRLRADLESLVEPATRGDPDSPLRWTGKSLRVLADQLQALGHGISYPTVATLLGQANRKTQEGTAHPDRNAQFEYINGRVKSFQKRGQPVISVDTK